MTKKIFLNGKVQSVNVFETNLYTAYDSANDSNIDINVVSFTDADKVVRTLDRQTFKELEMQAMTKTSLNDKDPFSEWRLGSDKKIRDAVDMGTEPAETVKASITDLPFYEVLQGWLELHEKKNADYGNAWNEILDKYKDTERALAYASGRLYEKANRVMSIVANGKAEVKEESVADNINDLGVCSAMTMAWLNGRKGE